MQTQLEDNGERSLRQDGLSGLWERQAFCEKADRTLAADREGAAAGSYAVAYFDVLRFKVVNDLFGKDEGDRLLRFISRGIRNELREGELGCRMSGDRFACFVHRKGPALERFVNGLLYQIEKYSLPFEIICNMGLYVSCEELLPADTMIDRAALAQASIKGSYTKKFCYYTETLRSDMLSEQEIVGNMAMALANRQFVVYYQPQYNHRTRMLVGAEALVRWEHPVWGCVLPGAFIPIFEKNGFITQLDLYVFSQVCVFIRRCLDENLAVPPISTNFSRQDIFLQDFVERLEEIRKRYQVPVKYLRVEITESAVEGSNQFVNQVVKKLHQHGYEVEMDDFGSGYSSLNVLKDIELDTIKLDMLLLKDASDSNRGGTILSSVVRMAKWLKTSVIAEGVETLEQADFLRSIGCEFIQGYLYARPMPETDYQQLLRTSVVGEIDPQIKLIENLNAVDFWDPKSQETLIFSNFVGGAAIFEYDGSKAEILRVNKKYLQEIGMNLSEKDLVTANPLSFFDAHNRKIFQDMLERAIVSMDEEECETWRTLSSPCCGEEKICIRSNVRVIGESGNCHLFYAMIRNITAEKNRFQAYQDDERRFKAASEQVNIYYWEYTVATHEMRPCFRCMRDLGLPALLTNYPDSAIEMGIFPPEVADQYRDWHRQIENGVEHLEAIMPLTVGRVPFHVRYTTEFDENGQPVKAYGSAALVV
ncbi:MAG: EAL domain-containing protein [Candidatus Limivicinus sp.]